MKFRRVNNFALVSLPDSIITIGGNCPSLASPTTNHIMRYKIDQWTKIGELLSHRLAHNAIQNDDKIFIIGGFDRTEFTQSDDSTWGT